MTMRCDCQLLTLDEDVGHCEARQPVEQDGQRILLLGDLVRLRRQNYASCMRCEAVLFISIALVSSLQKVFSIDQCSGQPYQDKESNRSSTIFRSREKSKT